MEVSQKTKNRAPMCRAGIPGFVPRPLVCQLSVGNLCWAWAGLWVELGGTPEPVVNKTRVEPRGSRAPAHGGVPPVPHHSREPPRAQHAARFPPALTLAGSGACATQTAARWARGFQPGPSPGPGRLSLASALGPLADPSDVRTAGQSALPAPSPPRPSLPHLNAAHPLPPGGRSGRNPGSSPDPHAWSVPRHILLAFM